MCDVTQSNFHQLLPTILDHINRASWLAFDCEYTALRHGEPESRLDDSPAVRHQRHVAAVAAGGGRTPIICQFGLAIFEDDTDGTLSAGGLQYVVRAYNFFLCPRAAAPALDEAFLCQAASLTFLSRHGFDFSRWVGDGLGYLSREQEAELRGQAERNTLFDSVIRGLAHTDGDRLQHLCSQVPVDKENIC
jgi:poly(A)-specific ribonuclease